MIPVNDYRLRWLGPIGLFLFGNIFFRLSFWLQSSPTALTHSTFVDKLSKIYRYLLQANDQELVSLRTELAFIESYAHLLQTRHGSGVSIQMTVPENYLTSLLPPLTLQLLVENAVEHNVILANRLLLIEIGTTKSGQLRVQNNLQRKHIRAQPTPAKDRSRLFDM